MRRWATVEVTRKMATNGRREAIGGGGGLASQDPPECEEHSETRKSKGNMAAVIVRFVLARGQRRDERAAVEG